MRFPAAILLSLALNIAVIAGAAAQPPATATATFAGGCFWCTEADFDKVEGVISTTSGYIGGMAVNPTYEQVVTGRTGHTEAVEVVYDPKVVSYERLLDVFWKNHDPLAKDRQFCDRGNQYRPGIFYHSEDQRALAEATRKTHQARFKQPIQTEITAATTFYKAEDYHQDYYKKNPVRYQFYRFNCGRDARLEELWGKPGS
ncbi:MAG: peptide-methionine (S)-S-oxide reductase MsrA [Xanthobacteraceae bacterium]|nr:peptide-methionine (S)-S-oxide reductase MsrA [Xanthobacteraceae bacterium]